MPSQLRTEHLLAAILSSTEDAVLSFGLDGTVQTWSPGAQRLYGYGESEIIGQPLARLLPVADTPGFDGLIRAAISGNFPHYETSPRLHKDGSQVLVRLIHTPVRDDHGHIIAIVENGSSVASNSIESAGEAHLKLLIDQMPMVVWTTDKELRITSYLGARLRGAKNRNDELLGKSVYEYLKCQDPHTTPIVQHYEALRGVSSQFEYKRNNRTFELHLEPLRSPSGEIIGVSRRRPRHHRTQEERRESSPSGHARCAHGPGELSRISRFARTRNPPRRAQQSLVRGAPARSRRFKSGQRSLRPSRRQSRVETARRSDEGAMPRRPIWRRATEEMNLPCCSSMAIPAWRVKSPAASNTRSARAGKSRASASASASAFFRMTAAACRTCSKPPTANSTNANAAPAAE